MPTTATAATRRKKTSRKLDEAPLIPILARKVREIEAKAQRGKLGPTNRVKFQVIAFLVREERARVKADADLADGARTELLKRLDGVATILAKTAARDTSLIQLLETDQATSPVAKRMRRDWLLESGAELPPEELVITDAAPVVTPVIPEALADRAGLREGLPSQAMTANGVVTVYSTAVATLQLGDIALYDVRASVNPAMQGDTVLLGMSALRQVEFSQRGDTLTLRLHPD